MKDNLLIRPLTMTETAEHLHMEPVHTALHLVL